MFVKFFFIRGRSESPQCIGTRKANVQMMSECCSSLPSMIAESTNRLPNTLAPHLPVWYDEARIESERSFPVEQNKKSLILFTDIGDTIIDEGTEVPGA